MRVIKSTARNKIRYAGYVGDERVTHWLASPADVHRHWEGALLTGEHEEHARAARDCLERELREEGYDISEYDDADDLLTSSALLYERMEEEGATPEQITKAICALAL
jgi:hypothetical protein